MYDDPQADDNNGGNTRNIIIIAFVLMAIGVLAATWVQTFSDVTETIPTPTPLPSQAQVFCHIGSEKDDLMENPEVQRILRERYGLSVRIDTMGSIEQAYLTPNQLEGVDCLWPSNTTALDIFRDNNPNLDFSDDIIFNSPIVFYSWTPIVEALVADGVVSLSADGFYVADTGRVVEMLTQDPRPTWQDLGVDQMFNSFNIVTTDPTLSNSGNMFYGLLLNMLNNGDVATIGDLETHITTVTDYYLRQGDQQRSSGDLFDFFVRSGMGATPIMANYESLIVEFSIANRDALAQIQEQVQVMYPQPTVWSSHPLIALTEEGRRLLDALKDPEIQDIAWEQHGFRTGLAGVDNDPAVLAVAGIPAQVQSIVNLPRANAMQRMVEDLNRAAAN